MHALLGNTMIQPTAGEGLEGEKHKGRRKEDGGRGNRAKVKGSGILFLPME